MNFLKKLVVRGIEIVLLRNGFTGTVIFNQCVFFIDLKIFKITPDSKAEINLPALNRASLILKFDDKAFDVATLSLALHQFHLEMHQTILSEMKRVARKIIIIDYFFPLPKNITGTGSRFA